MVTQFKNSKTHVPYTADMIASLKHEVDRTGLGIYALWTRYGDSPELQPFSRSLVQTWLTNPPQMIHKAHYDAVIALYRSLPDKVLLVERTPDMREKLRTEKSRTRVSPRRLWEMFSGQKSWKIFDEISYKRIERWGYTNTKQVESEHFDAVIHAYQSLPTVEPETVPITQAMIDKLEQHKTLTGYGFSSIYQEGVNRGCDVCNEMSKSTIYNWVNSIVLEVYLHQYNAIIDLYTSLPEHCYTSLGSQKTRYKQKRVVVTDEFKEKVAEIRYQSKISLTRRLKYSETPKGLTDGVIRNIVLGKTQTILESHQDFLNELHATMFTEKEKE